MAKTIAYVQPMRHAQPAAHVQREDRCDWARIMARSGEEAQT